MNVLHVIGRFGMGGDTVAVLSNYKYIISESKNITFDVLTHNKGFIEDSSNNIRKYIYLSGDVRKIGIFKYLIEMIRSVPRGYYDAIHVHTSSQAGIALLGAFLLGIKIRICHSHTNSVQRKISKYQQIIILPILKLLIYVFSTQKIACGIMAARYLYYGRNYKIIHNGIDIYKCRSVKKKNPLNECGNCDSTLLIGQIGRFSSMKNQSFSIKLSEELENRSISHKLIFLGDGENYNRLLEDNKSNNIHFLGRRDSYDYYGELDLVILPSLPGEGLPITAIEAQVFSCSVIASTYITKEIDLGLGLVEFLDIYDMDKWIKKISAQEKKIIIDEIEIKRKLSESGFLLEDTYKEWLSVYL